MIASEKPRPMLVLSTSPHEYQGAGGRTRIVSAIRSVSQQWTVHLMCWVPLRRYVSAKVRKLARQRLADDTGSEVIFRPLFPRSRFNWAYQACIWISAWSTARYCRKRQIRLVHAHGDFAADIGLAMKRFGGFALVSDFHGSVSDEYRLAAGPSYSFQQLKRLEDRENRVLAHSDAAIFVSNAMRAHFERKYQLVVSCFDVIPCATNDDFRLSREGRSKLRQQWDLANKIVFVYVGSVRGYQMLDETLQLFKAIVEEVNDTHLLILSSHRQAFTRLLERHQIPNDLFTLISLNQDEVLDALQAADIGFLIRQSSAVNIVASPTKFAEYLMSGVPVVLTPKVGDFSQVAAAENVGFVCREPVLSPELLEFIQYVKANRGDVSQRCHQLAQSKYGWSHHGEILQGVYNKAIGVSFESKVI